MSGDAQIGPPDDTALRAALIALVDFHVASGCDLALDEAPVDRFAEEAERRARHAQRQEASRAQARAQLAREPAPAAPALVPGALDPAAAESDARAQAAAARDLAELEALLDAFTGCPLRASAKRTVFADGTPGSRVMLVGEAPGAEEDRTGKPFVGRAGRLLDKMLAAIGLSRADVYIANVIPWRPPGNRTPTPQEIAVCLPFVARQIALARPEILVCMGNPASQTLLGVKEGIIRARGRWRDYDTGAGTIPALPMLHPAYLLRNPAHKALAWQDLRALRARLAREVVEG